MILHIDRNNVDNVSKFHLASKYENILAYSEHIGSAHHSAYIPCFETLNLPLPSTANLINSRDRYYLKKNLRNRSSSSINTIDIDSQSSDLFGDDCLDNIELHDQDQVIELRAMKRVLDLGTLHLQRIVSQLKGLTNDTSNDRSHLNPNASKAAGLPGYCDYLVGNTGSIDAGKNKSRLQFHDPIKMICEDAHKIKKQLNVKKKITTGKKSKTKSLRTK